MCCALLLTFSLAPTVAPPKETILLKGYKQSIHSVMVTKDGRWLFALDCNHRLLIRDLTAEQRRTPRPRPVLANGSGLVRDLPAEQWRCLGILGPKWLGFSADGKYAFSAGANRRNVWRGNSGYLGLPEQIYSEDRALWATNVYKEDRFPDTLPSPEGHRYPITAAAFSADGKILVTACGKGGLPGEVKTWHVPSGKERLPRVAYTAAAFFSATGEDDLLGLPVTLRQAPGVDLLAISPDGSTLATVYQSTRFKEIGSGTAKLWDLGTGKPKGNVLIPDGTIHAVHFSPDGKALILGVNKKAQGEVWWWDVPAGKATKALGSHPRPVHAVAVSGDGRYVASGCAGGVVKLWGVAEGKELQSRKVSPDDGPVRALSFLPDGQTLAVAGGNQRGWVRLWIMRKPAK